MIIKNYIVYEMDIAIDIILKYLIKNGISYVALDNVVDNIICKEIIIEDMILRLYNGYDRKLLDKFFEPISIDKYINIVDSFTNLERISFLETENLIYKENNVPKLNKKLIKTINRQNMSRKKSFPRG